MKDFRKDPPPGVQGCGNHTCIFVKPHGQATNGPCSCIGRPMTSGEALRLRRNIKAMQDHMVKLYDETVHYRKALTAAFGRCPKCGDVRCINDEEMVQCYSCGTGIGTDGTKYGVLSTVMIHDGEKG